MNYAREWRDGRNAAGFAPACARLALAHYRGDHRDSLERALRLVEAFVQGRDVGRSVFRRASDAVWTAASESSGDATLAIYAVVDAMTVAHGMSDVGSGLERARQNVGQNVYNATWNAADAGATWAEIRAAFLLWWAKDVGVTLATEQRAAVIAALIAGDEATAREVAA
jgi:hypothetical protein